jgi:phenylacetate-coenzyme A ligase PaaK-like adenylate-forming protein
MFNLQSLFDAPPYGMDADAKRALFINALADLTRHHYERSKEYRRIVDLFGHCLGCERQLEDFPFIPVRLFKEYELLSVDRSDVVKTITSSGTTGQAVSKIFLDKATAANQTKVLVKISSSFIGRKRLPLLIVDSPAVIKDRALFSARGAGILGFSMLGYDNTYLLDENYQINFEQLENFQKKHANERVLLFGFTSIIWEHLCRKLKKAGRSLNLQGVLIHGGGWKKLATLEINTASFNETANETIGVSTICNYYGMVEQAGSIFMECEKGHLHSSIFSEIIIRDPATFSSLSIGKAGLVQLFSLLPLSYPGHSILSEDIGEILGWDNCPCGRRGTFFRIHGRIKNAEIRGCSDTYVSEP